jgi:hypothetical protein
MTATLAVRLTSAALCERASVMKRMSHGSSPGSPFSRPIGRATTPPSAVEVTSQHERALAIVLDAAASSPWTSSSADMGSSLAVDRRLPALNARFFPRIKLRERGRPRRLRVSRRLLRASPTAFGGPGAAAREPERAESRQRAPLIDPGA